MNAPGDNLSSGLRLNPLISPSHTHTPTMNKKKKIRGMMMHDSSLWIITSGSLLATRIFFFFFFFFWWSPIFESRDLQHSHLHLFHFCFLFFFFFNSKFYFSFVVASSKIFFIKNFLIKINVFFFYRFFVIMQEFEAAAKDGIILLNIFFITILQYSQKW